MHIMNKSGQVVMKKDLRNETDIVSTISGRFRTLIRNLVQGNTRKAHSIAEAARQGILTDGSRIAFQNLIEDMAQDQALRNALINLPSAVPGIGTLISLGLISVEDFFLLDQGVKLILAMCHLHGRDFDDPKAREDFVLMVLGEAYGLAPAGSEGDPDTIVRKLMTMMLPKRYMNIGINRAVRKFLRRLLPFRRKSRLLPGGFGVVMSAWDAYDTIVNVGQITLRHLSHERHEIP